MKTIHQESGFRSSRGVFIITAILLAATLLIASNLSASAESQRLFPSPEDALKSFAEAVKAKDKALFNQILGPNAKDLLSGDEVQDASEFDELVSNLTYKTSLVKEGDSKVILHIGKEDWPFPIPIVKKNNQWFFDTAEGREEILNRRVGENELIAIYVCHSYVKAQREYALKDWDGDGIFAYAQKLRSDRDKKNGLFWRTKPDEPVSPFGELVAKARIEGYKRDKAVFREEPEPFHGYYFKILTGQGKNVPGGRYNYVINGNMVAGFAFVAFPSTWGKSGVMTFIVNQQGKVYQKNLGTNTMKIAQEMKAYNPDKTWTLVKE